MGSTLGGAQWKVKFGEFSEAYLVFADVRVRHHRSSEIEELLAVIWKFLISTISMSVHAGSLESSVSFYVALNGGVRIHLNVCATA